MRLKKYNFIYEKRKKKLCEIIWNIFLTKGTALIYTLCENSYKKEEVTMPIRNKWSESVHHKTEKKKGTKIESIKFTQCAFYLDRIDVNADDERY